MDPTDPESSPSVGRTPPGEGHVDRQPLARPPGRASEPEAHRTFGQRRRDAEALAETLSKRQREVLTHLLRGDAPKQIAPVLGVTVHTVNEHIKEIHRHFNVTSRAELLALFVPTWY